MMRTRMRLLLPLFLIAAAAASADLGPAGIPAGVAPAPSVAAPATPPVVSPAPTGPARPAPVFSNAVSPVAVVLPAPASSAVPDLAVTASPPVETVASPPEKAGLKPTVCSVTVAIVEPPIENGISIYQQLCKTFSYIKHTIYSGVDRLAVVSVPIENVASAAADIPQSAMATGSITLAAEAGAVNPAGEFPLSPERQGVSETMLAAGTTVDTAATEASLVPVSAATVDLVTPAETFRFKAWKSPETAKTFFAAKLPVLDPTMFRPASSTGRIKLPPHHPRLPVSSPSTPKIPAASDPALIPFSTKPKPVPAKPPTPDEIAVALQSQPGLAALPPSPFPDRVPGEEDAEERKLNISGTKTFEMKKADVKGDLGHFSTENYDSIPGFHLDQSMHLEIDGNITKSAKVSAVLDDKEDEDRRFTINLDGPVWDLTMGDFPLGLADTEFQLFRKEVRGLMAQGAVTENLQAMFLYSQSKGRARREQFRGAGQQQEFRLAVQPMVQNSEKVTIDGRLMTRGSDYLVDYEDGVIKFLPHVLPIEVTSWIVIEYEVNDSKMAFKRNLYGTRLLSKHGEGRRLGLSWLRELDSDTPKSETGSSTVKPMQHDLIGFDGDWRLTDALSLSGETALSLYDPNRLSDTASSDRTIADHAMRLQLRAKTQTLTGDLGFRRVGKDFRMVGREGGVTELGERGLASDIMKGSGRLTWQARPKLQLFAGLESSKTNLSNDPAVSRIEFRDLNGGAAYSYRDRSRVEARYGLQTDEERLRGPVTDRDKGVGAVVWDHEFGPVFAQSKIEHTTYDDGVNAASGSRILNVSTSIGSDRDKKLTWTAGASRVTLDDDIDLNEERSDTRNYTLDLNYEPSRALNARGILEWRTEDDLLVNSRQTGQIADSRIRYQPNRDWTSQFKYKVENTSKVIRDASLDPRRYVVPTSLPLSEDEKDQVLTRFENPVQKSTSNFTTSWRAGEKVETTFDWKRRDLKDRASRLLVSLNDRKSYEVRYTPLRKLKLTGEYEDGEMRAAASGSKLLDTVRRFQVRNEFFEGYIIDMLWEDLDENDIYADSNDKRTTGKAVDFQRIFSARATLEAGVQRNVIRSFQPSKEWETRAAFVLTPSARNQRYRLFVTNKQIDSAKPGTHREGGLSFSQFIGSDSMVEGEVKRVESTAGLLGNGYEGTVANAKMIISF